MLLIKILFLIILLPFIISIIACLIHQYWIWRQTNRHMPSYTYMKPSLIKKLYAVESSRWKESDTEFNGAILLTYRINNYTKCYIMPKYGIFGYWWLCFNSLFYHCRNAIKSRRSVEINTLKTVLETSQKDIEKIQKEAEKSIRLAEKLTN